MHFRIDRLRRSLRVREGETAKKVNREEWMLHLPEGRNIASEIKSLSF